MTTSFVTSADGLRIAYDVSGAGEAVVLLHGGMHTRQHWHDAGYVERLKSDFKVIAIDIRGGGESDKPADPACYTTEKHCRDILAVAAACGLTRFTIWGYSYGANIGRYLAAQSPDVNKFVMVGFPFGPGASGPFLRFIAYFRNHWLPLLQAQADKTLDLQALSAKDQEDLQRGEIPIILAWLSANMDWETIEPGDLLCPTLWLTGSKDGDVMTSMKEYEAALAATKVRTQVLEGLNHGQEFTEVDQVLTVVLPFLRS